MKKPRLNKQEREDIIADILDITQMRINGRNDDVVIDFLSEEGMDLQLQFNDEQIVTDLRMARDMKNKLMHYCSYIGFNAIFEPRFNKIKNHEGGSNVYRKAVKIYHRTEDEDVYVATTMMGCSPVSHYMGFLMPLTDHWDAHPDPKTGDAVVITPADLEGFEKYYWSEPEEEDDEYVFVVTLDGVQQTIVAKHEFIYDAGYLDEIEELNS